MTDEFHHFAKLHQYDTLGDFKEAWDIWTTEHADLIRAETDRLIQLGYKGDVMDKMFKSVRYYFRKKTQSLSNVITPPSETPHPPIAVARKKPPKGYYLRIPSEYIDLMDRHIQMRPDAKPSDGFIDFLQMHPNMVVGLIQQLREKGIDNVQEIEKKIKKTYKNRYYHYFHPTASSHEHEGVDIKQHKASEEHEEYHTYEKKNGLTPPHPEANVVCVSEEELCVL